MFFIIILYGINTKNETALFVSVALLIVNIIIETIGIIKKRLYKTAYWIAILNIFNIFCIILFMMHLSEGKHLTDTEQMIKHILLSDRFRIAFYASLMLSSLLKSERFKVEKESPDIEEV
jgi:hypothetical protein